MAMKPHGIMGRLLHRRALRRWNHASQIAGDAELSTLRAYRQQARQLRGPLQELLHVADNRLALPRIGSNTFARPSGTDWSWRPQLWRGPLPEQGVAPALNKSRLGTELAIFHDCPAQEIALRQIRNTRDHDLAAFGVSLEVLHFEGSFLSLVVDLPPDVCDGLEKRHLIQLSTVIEREAPITIQARLNVKSGPNTDQILLPLPDQDGECDISFDLAYSQLNEKRTSHMWIDLMFDAPSMTKTTLRDLTICRHPRAAL
ncbi:DUF6478 family protein [Yoonia sp. SS1-5]|uniref:DUF6478 family protein n=1 Tax=Yoonia rhodophyticola TaxID=3137370 RepID=A0AAN0NL98_9RHOB